ncbi:MAG: LexA family protein [Methylocystis sp.]
MSWEHEEAYSAATDPDLPSDINEGPIDFNQIIIQNPIATFAVRIAGDSMRDIGIRTNDIAVVNRAGEVTNGCIVMARIGDGFTIKRYCKGKDGIRLESANPDYPDIEITEDTDWEIWGVVKRSIRMLTT